MCVCAHVRASEHACVCAQSCPTLCDPMDCSPPGSSVHGISQARILKWIAIFLLQGIFLTQRWNPRLLCLVQCRWILYPLSQGSPHYSRALIIYTGERPRSFTLWFAINQGTNCSYSYGKSGGVNSRALKAGCIK